MARKATSEKRRDNKNRVLRTGESQRKDGRYVYNYIDTFGNPQSVYSWKLVPTEMKNAGKAYKYRLYRHIRTSKEIIKKSYLIFA